jgi:hypothetical protein
MLKYHLQVRSSRAFSNLSNMLRVLGMLSTNSISFRRRDPFLWQIPECPSSFRQFSSVLKPQTLLPTPQS